MSRGGIIVVVFVHVICLIPWVTLAEAALFFYSLQKAKGFEAD